MKKLISLLLAVVMVLSFSTVALAATSPVKVVSGGGDAPSTTVSHWFRSRVHAGTKFVEPKDSDENEKSQMDKYIEEAEKAGYLVKSWFIVYVGENDDVVSVGIWKRASDLVFANGSEIEGKALGGKMFSYDFTETSYVLVCRSK